METLYWSTGRNGKWTTEPSPESFWIRENTKVTESRLESEYQLGIKTLWINGKNMGKLFPSKELQIADLMDRGLI